MDMMRKLVVVVSGISLMSSMWFSLWLPKDSPDVFDTAVINCFTDVDARIPVL